MAKKQREGMAVAVAAVLVKPELEGGKVLEKQTIKHQVQTDIVIKKLYLRLKESI